MFCFTCIGMQEYAYDLMKNDDLDGVHVDIR